MPAGVRLCCGSCTEGSPQLIVQLVSGLRTSTEMNKKRTAGMTAVAIFNFVFGGVGLLACFFGLVAANSFKGTHAGMLLLAISLLSLPSAGAAIVSGVGILKLARWARTWTFVYAILSILGTFIGLALTAEIQKLSPDPQASNPLLTIVLGCIYPAILLYLINTRRWKETFSDAAVQVA